MSGTEASVVKDKPQTTGELLGGLAVLSLIIYFSVGLLFSWNFGLILVGLLCGIFALGKIDPAVRSAAALSAILALSNANYFGSTKSSASVVSSSSKIDASIISESDKLKIQKQKEQSALEEKKRVELAAEQERLAQVEEEKQAAADLEQKHKSGEFCESAWDGSVSNVIDAVKNTLRNPSSFEHINTYVKAVDSEGLNEVTMSYRAQNGFGGMNEVFMVAKIRSSDCEVVEIY
jgi:hypothetical protein